MSDTDDWYVETDPATAEALFPKAALFIGDRLFLDLATGALARENSNGWYDMWPAPPRSDRDTPPA